MADLYILRLRSYETPGSTLLSVIRHLGGLQAPSSLTLRVSPVPGGSQRILPPHQLQRPATAEARQGCRPTHPPQQPPIPLPISGRGHIRYPHSARPTTPQCLTPASSGADRVASRAAPLTRWNSTYVQPTPLACYHTWKVMSHSSVAHACIHVHAAPPVPPPQRPRGHPTGPQREPYATVEATGPPWPLIRQSLPWRSRVPQHAPVPTHGRHALRQAWCVPICYVCRS